MAEPDLHTQAELLILEAVRSIPHERIRVMVAGLAARPTNSQWQLIEEIERLVRAAVIAIGFPGSSDQETHGEHLAELLAHMPFCPRNDDDPGCDVIHDGMTCDVWDARQWEEIAAQVRAHNGQPERLTADQVDVLLRAAAAWEAEPNQHDPRIPPAEVADWLRWWAASDEGRRPVTPISTDSVAAEQA